MQHDHVSTVPLIAQHNVGFQLAALREAVGTREFESALNILLSSLIEPQFSAGLVDILRMQIEVHRVPHESENPLSCLCTIERCLSESTGLPPREVEVCARVLFGLTSAGIAVDLYLCENTVKTYRKRAYHRLAVGSERELISWYLRMWARWKSRTCNSGLNSPHELERTRSTALLSQRSEQVDR